MNSPSPVLRTSGSPLPLTLVSNTAKNTPMSSPEDLFRDVWEVIDFTLPPLLVPAAPTGPITVPNSVLLSANPANYLLSCKFVQHPDLSILPSTHDAAMALVPLSNPPYFEIITFNKCIIFKDAIGEIFGTIKIQPTEPVVSAKFVIDEQPVERLLCAIPNEGYDLIDDLLESLHLTGDQQLPDEL